MALVRVPLIQLIGLTLGLIAASWLPIPLLGAALAEVRLLLVMTLGVSFTYTGVLLRRGALKPAPVQVYEPWADDEPHGIELGR